jgi:hypothetical protein
MTLACALSSAGPGWMSVAIFGVPLFGILLARFIVSARSPRNGPMGGPRPPKVPDFPLARAPELRSGGDEKQADELVGV